MNIQTQNMPAQSPAKAFQVYMQKYKSQLEMALPKHLTADRMMRLSLTAFSQNPKLQECSSNSIFSSIIIASQLGLEPGVNGQGYLVPYKGTCTFIPGWKGLVDLAQRGGRSSVWTGAVYEGDEFDYMLGDSPYCRHKPCGEFDNDKLTHVYAIGRVKDSEMPIIEVWPVKKVRAHFVKTVVKGLQPNHYSHKHFEAYARKVALLQVLKYMPQSIELSNAMDVSNAQESGKGVTIDGDFVNIEPNNQEQNDDQNQNIQNLTQNDVHQSQEQAQQQVQTFDQEEADYAPTFAQIKKGILTAKTQAHLEVMEEQALDHANSNERKQLMTLVKAQSQKFEESSVKKPEPQHEETPLVEEIQLKKPTSTDLKKEYLLKINKAESVGELNMLHEQFIINDALTGPHLAYLKDAYMQAKDKFKQAEQPTAQQEVQQAPAINEIKSSNIADGLKTSIEGSENIDALTAVAQTIRDNKPKMTTDDMAEVLKVYAARKKFLEDQQDMFAGVEEVSYVDAVIKRIQNAKSQDDINAEYADPAFDDLSSADREHIDKEAQLRESELQD